jgi:hypothetical protein
MGSSPSVHSLSITHAGLVSRVQQSHNDSAGYPYAPWVIWSVPTVSRYVRSTSHLFERLLQKYPLHGKIET